MDCIYDGVSLQNMRDSNMDSLLLRKRLINGKKILIAVVCDGVGSMSDGAFAAAHTTKMLNEWMGSLENIERVGLKIRDAVIDINAFIFSTAKKNNINTASTISALLLEDDLYYIVHAGDSRIYSYCSGTLVKLTIDDTSYSGKLTSCIGKSENIELHYCEGKSKGKTFLLCSDGLYKRMDPKIMITNMEFAGKNNKKKLKESVENMTRYVIECGECDNISIALIKVES